MAFQGPGFLRRSIRALRRFMADQASRAELTGRPDPAVKRDLAVDGLSRSDYLASQPLTSRRRRRMLAMMDHFRVDPTRIAPKYWSARRDAEWVCAECAKAGRCRRWLERSRANDAPRVFCPNAELFDQIAADARKTEDGRGQG